LQKVSRRNNYLISREVDRAYQKYEQIKSQMEDDAKSFQHKIESISEINDKLEKENAQLRARLTKLVQENKEESLKYSELQERYNYEINKFEQERRQMFEKFKEAQDQLHAELVKMTEEKNQLQNQRTQFLENITELDKRHSGKVISNNHQSE